MKSHESTYADYATLFKRSFFVVYATPSFSKDACQNGIELDEKECSPPPAMPSTNCKLHVDATPQRLIFKF